MPRRAANAGAFCAAPLADRSNGSSGGTSVDGRSGVDDLLSGGGRGSPNADEDGYAVLVPMASEHMIGRDEAMSSRDVGQDAADDHSSDAANSSSSGGGVKRRPSSVGSATEGSSNHEDRAAAALAAARAAVWMEKLPTMSEESTIMDEGQVRS